MATRARYESPSPVTTIAKPLEPPVPSSVDTLSSSHFHAQYPQFQTAHSPHVPQKELFYDPRFSSGRYPGAKKSPVPELPILSYHNAVPEHFRSTVPSGEPVSVVLPPVGPGNGGVAVQNGNGNGNYPSPRAQGYAEVAEIPFGYTKQHVYVPGEGKPRSLSIQSLISSPGLDAPAMYSKRKGSDAEDSVRSTRHGSLVPTSVSIEDPDVREVVEALGGLKGDFTPTPASPQLPQSHENEPLLNLITGRAHPLLSSAITSSLSAYGASKSYSASFRYAAESVENRVGLPISGVVSAVGRRTGLDNVLRRNLARPPDSKKRKTREPTALETHTWKKRLMLTTSGFGVALNEESLKNLRYCLQWLRFLNVHLSKLVTSLRSVVEELDDTHLQLRDRCDTGRRVELVAHVEALKADVVGTMKKVVEVVSNYTPRSLPDNTRELIKRHIFSLPQRFAAANASAPSSPTSDVHPEDSDSPRSSANRVLVLAREGLDMMVQVSEVVEGTIVRAEEWCERLGKRKGPAGPEQGEEEGNDEGEEEDGPEKKRGRGRVDAEGDVWMESGRKV